MQNTHSHITQNTHPSSGTDTVCVRVHGGVLCSVIKRYLPCAAPSAARCLTGPATGGAPRVTETAICTHQSGSGVHRGTMQRADGPSPVHHLLPSVMADLLAGLGRHGEARLMWQRAADLTRNARERELLLARAHKPLPEGGKP